jgi:ElaA protein
MSVEWRCKSFNELTVYELYAIIQLRIEVFVVEQNCVFQDADDKDQRSYHLMGWIGEDLAAYTRLVPKHIIYDKTSIGRVVTSPKYRGTGIGRELMIQSIEKAFALWGKEPIQIGAQLYLKKFYESLGFVVFGPVYLEDGIDHVKMLLNP